MRRQRFRHLTGALLSGVLAVLLVAAAPAAAAVPADGPGALPYLLLAADGGLTLEQATLKVREAFGGKIVAARPDTRDGRRGYRIRVLADDGRVRTLFVDALTGRISRI